MRIHPPDLLLRKLLVPDSKLPDRVKEHAAECSRCSRKLKRLHLQQFLAFADYEKALSAGARKLRDLTAAYTRERTDAPGLISELLKHPPERRLILVHNHPRFHTWGVFERLLEMSPLESSRDAAVSEELARLALTLADQLDESVYGDEAIEDLRGRAWAYLGNARRVQSDLYGAQEALKRSLLHLRRGTRDPWERAIWLDLKGSLLRAQRHFDQALRLLKRSLTLFVALGDEHRAGRTLVNMDNVYHHAGRPEEGIPLLYRALELIDPEQEPRLVLMARHNLADNLADAGRFMEAQRLSIQARPLYRHFNEPLVRHRRCWVEAKIARGLGQTIMAETLLLTARAGFMEQAASYDLALVSLELAALYSGQGRAAEVKQLAEQLVPYFSSQQIQREALAAFQLWHQAVQSEAAEADMAVRVAKALRGASHEPQESL